MRKSFLTKCLSFVIAVGAVFFGSQPASAEGDLAIRAKKLTLKLGSKESDYSMEPKMFQLTTGQAYKLEITGRGFKEYELEAEEFFRNIWIRRIEVEGVELDTPVLNRIAFEENFEETEAEITFVPIRSGEYEFAIEGLEQKGMEGRFIVR